MDNLSQPDKNIIIEFLLQSRELERLVDLPIIPLVSGHAASLRTRQGSDVAHVLQEELDEKVFSHIDTNAVALRMIPRLARDLLVEGGPSNLNVKNLNLGQAAAYVRSARTQFATGRTFESTWSWDRTRGWLALFWEWISSCRFAGDLLASLKSEPLLPTTAGELRTTGEDVFFYPADLTERQRAALSLVGIHFLDSSVPPFFLEHHRPKLVKSVSVATDLLGVLNSAVPECLDSDAAGLLRSHLASVVSGGVRLSKANKETLRALPIHPVLTSDSNSADQSVTTTIKSLPPSAPFYCIVHPLSLSIPLPRLQIGTFVHATADEQQLLEQIDYAAAFQPLSEKRLVHLFVESISEQSPQSRLRLLRYLSGNRTMCTVEIMDRLRISPLICVGSGDRYLAPKDVIDPSSSIAFLMPLHHDDHIFKGSTSNQETVDILSQLRLLRRTLDSDFVSQRIQDIACLPAESGDAHEAARLLLSALEKTRFNCVNVQYDPNLAWIPTRKGLRAPRSCRDDSQKTLCDRVWPLLDMAPIQSDALRMLLGWHEPISIDTVIQQFDGILSATAGTVTTPYYLDLTIEFGRRLTELSTPQLEALAERASSKPWVLVEGGLITHPAYAVFDLSSRLYQFGKLSLDIAHRPGVKTFLLRMGCSERYVSHAWAEPTNHEIHLFRPSNTSIIDVLRMLKTDETSSRPISDAAELIRALDIPSLSDSERSDIVVPGNDGHLHPIAELFYNDLGPRAHHLLLPSDRVQVHPSISVGLVRELRITSLGSLHLEPLDLEYEDMRENLTTRIKNVLRAYDIEQAFNEFLANAADAGATLFNLALDTEPRRRASCSEVLSENIAQFCTGDALVAYNNAEFTKEDIRGICRIGRGGKEDRDGTIGRFGLGSLSFYHFSEVSFCYMLETHS